MGGERLRAFRFQRSLFPGLCVAFVAIQPLFLAAEQPEERYLWLVTIDGLRLHEVFNGAEEALISSEDGGVENVDRTRRRYWRDDPQQRRETLLPFFWQVIAEQGQVFGSLEQQCVARVANSRYFSYPGYQELLCGFPDDRIDSNDKSHNRNVNVLEWLARKPAYAGQVAAFTSWDVFPYILNVPRSNLYVNAGWAPFEEATSEVEKAMLNRASRELPRYCESVRYDALTYAGAKHYLDVIALPSSTCRWAKPTTGATRGGTIFISTPPAGPISTSANCGSTRSGATSIAIRRRC